MTDLSEPTKELAARLLSRVSYDQRLLVQKFFQLTGALKIDIYSLEKAIEFLETCDRRYSPDDLLVRGSKVSIDYVDLNCLKNWIGFTLGDTELAEAMNTELGEGPKSRSIAVIGKYFITHVGPVRDLLKQRLKQCKEVVGGEARTQP
ncbi:MAG: hypothetical protein PHE15_03950 [Dehalococcoidales bacterium]|nr:hypothetical protein [Dehalococcoidales bacterium]